MNMSVSRFLLFILVCDEHIYLKWQINSLNYVQSFFSVDRVIVTVFLGTGFFFNDRFSYISYKY